MGEDLSHPPYNIYVQNISIENPDIIEPDHNLSNCVQLDGNMSLSESESATLQQPVPKIDKITCALNLPTVATYNCRSIFPKLGNLKNDLIEREIDVGFMVEIWEKSESKNHQMLIEQLLEMDGLKYISTARPSGWGGAAIIANMEKYSLEKMNIFVPHNLEIIWGLLKPKSEEAKYKKIILCSYYSPPNSRKNSKLTDHIISTLHMLKTKYPDSPMILGADKNSMDIRPILNCGLQLKQIVDLPSRQGKILDIIIMNIPQYYNSPIIIPPVPCDDPTAGVPSDHSVPVCYPHTDRHNPPRRRYRTVTYRPLPESSVRQFGQWITAEDFNTINDDLSTSDHAKAIENLLLSNLNKFCPEKSMRVGPQDKPFMNFELKQIHRRRQREYLKRGNSAKYEKLASLFEDKYKAAAKLYLNTKVNSLKETKPGQAYKILKDMGAQPGDCTDSHTFTLPSHDELSALQSAELIAEHFASISREYPPLNIESLPERVKLNLETKCSPPTISEHECYEKIKAAKKPRSSVPGDLPCEIVKEFAVELALPLHKLLNNIVKSAIWPEQWRMEYITPIGKIPYPESEDDLRPIALTAFFSKVMEQFVVMWLLKFIGDKIDFRQYGGTKGNSVCHYLIEFINFILYNQDNLEPTAVLACLIDFSKAFNRLDHNLVITKLSDMGVPAWLLKLVIAFLTERTMVVRYKGETSTPRLLPGGSPQGTLLGLLLFLVLVNDVGFEDQINNVGEVITCKRRIKDFNQIHLKYVDDLTVAESVSMKTQLTAVSVDGRPQPDDFRDRTGHQLKPEHSKVFSQLTQTQKYAEDNCMKVNFKKTKMMLFNPGVSRDFLPKFSVNDNEIQLVEKTKLLGVVLSSDMSWSPNTDDIVLRANHKLWMLRRLLKLGADQEDLKDVYQKQIRSVLEFAVPVWHSSLTGVDRLRIERVQKTACHIILGDEYRSYTSALRTLHLDSLFVRRQKLCKSFAKKCYNNTKFTTWFKRHVKHSATRSTSPRFNKVYCRLNRFENSPISYLTEILNRMEYLK